jgi:hypothetical protein
MERSKEDQEILELLKDLSIKRALKFLDEEKIEDHEADSAFAGYCCGFTEGFREGIMTIKKEYDLVKKPSASN